MKKEYIDMLCCPHCYNKLELEIQREENEEIIEGKFTCQKCKKTYEIKDGIPVMM